MKIIVFCNAGMSSGLMVNKMRKIANPEDDINAYQSSRIKELAGTVDVVFLSPALRMQLKEVKEICDPLNIPCESIDMKIYGFGDGEALYKRATQLVKSKKNK